MQKTVKFVIVSKSCKHVDWQVLKNTIASLHKSLRFQNNFLLGKNVEKRKYVIRLKIIFKQPHTHIGIMKFHLCWYLYYLDPNFDTPNQNCLPRKNYFPISN